MPSNLTDLHDLLRSLSFNFQVHELIAVILEDYEKRLSLLEDSKNLLTDIQKRYVSLELRYSELLYKLSEINQSLK